MISALLQTIILAMLEIVLGLDNLLMINLLALRVSPKKRKLARSIGVIQGLGVRLLLVAFITYTLSVIHKEIVFGWIKISVHSLLLLSGGVFLVWKATTELHHHIEHPTIDEAEKHMLVNRDEGNCTKCTQSATPVAITHESLRRFSIQSFFMSTVFSLDSVFTAIGISQHISVMVIGITMGASAMLLSVHKVGEMLQAYPSLKTLALAFVLSIGSVLVIEGIFPDIAQQHVTNYLYVSMLFSLFVEGLNIRRSKNAYSGIAN